MKKLFIGTYAPSTLGSFLRAFKLQSLGFQFEFPELRGADEKIARRRAA